MECGTHTQNLGRRNVEWGTRAGRERLWIVWQLTVRSQITFQWKSCFFSFSVFPVLLLCCCSSQLPLNTRLKRLWRESDTLHRAPFDPPWKGPGRPQQGVKSGDWHIDSLHLLVIMDHIFSFCLDPSGRAQMLIPFTCTNLPKIRSPRWLLFVFRPFHLFIKPIPIDLMPSYSEHQSQAENLVK